MYLLPLAAHTPDRSGWPSAVWGAGAERFGLLSGPRGIEPAGQQKQMLDRSLAGPGAQGRPLLAGSGLTAGQRMEYFAAAIRCRLLMGRGKHHLDAIAAQLNATSQARGAAAQGQR